MTLKLGRNISCHAEHNVVAGRELREKRGKELLTPKKSCFPNEFKLARMIKNVLFSLLIKITAHCTCATATKSWIEVKSGKWDVLQTERGTGTRVK